MSETVPVNTTNCGAFAIGVDAGAGGAGRTVPAAADEHPKTGDALISIAAAAMPIAKATVLTTTARTRRSILRTVRPVVPESSRHPIMRLQGLVHGEGPGRSAGRHRALRRAATPIVFVGFEALLTQPREAPLDHPTEPKPTLRSALRRCRVDLIVPGGRRRSSTNGG